MEKHIEFHEISVEIESRHYTGLRIVEGTQSLDQFVVYRGLCLSELKGDHPSSIDGAMLANAEQMLKQLVSGRLIASTRRPARFRQLVIEHGYHQ